MRNLIAELGRSQCQKSSDIGRNKRLHDYMNFKVCRLQYVGVISVSFTVLGTILVSVSFTVLQYLYI